ncbi:hypothetical protein F4810DRAFT_678758 [Camillea tinctor]|nr:hypothetical protein F4810DRAFT_678758 [Camillea tinctor]
MAVQLSPESLDYTSSHGKDIDSLQSLLVKRAKSKSPRCLLFYPPGNVINPVQISYKSMYQQAQHNSALVRSLSQFVKLKSKC